jgi:hypothetical protein
MKNLKLLLRNIFELLMFLMIVSFIGTIVFIGVSEAIGYEYELYQVIWSVILLNVLIHGVFSVIVSSLTKNNFFNDTPK